MALNVVDILHGCKLFSSVPAGSFQKLAALAAVRNFRKGQLVFRENDPCPGVYVVGAGAVRVFKTGPGGKEHILHIVGPGETFAEVAAIGGFALPASAEAVSKTTAALLPTEGFRRLLHGDTELAQGMLLGLTLWVRHLVSLMEDIVLRDAAGRLARFLLDAQSNAQGLIKLPGLKRHVASHLNLTGETLSRTLRRMIDAELIAEHKNRGVELLNVKALRRVAEGNYPRL
ncbi:MAG: Crp/Fnr family transcriptional regulator [Pirellulales bacterium]|nr:Crp/Fnr family transcriptional regulator [Pirellulales bacterium]